MSIPAAIQDDSAIQHIRTPDQFPPGAEELQRPDSVFDADPGIVIQPPILWDGLDSDMIIRPPPHIDNGILAKPGGSGAQLGAKVYSV